MTEERFLSIPELAKMLGVSRVTVYNRVKRGNIPATKVGRTYVITDKTIRNILGKEMTEEERKEIDAAVARTIKEYGEVLQELSKM